MLSNLPSSTPITFAPAYGLADVPLPLEVFIPDIKAPRPPSAPITIGVLEYSVSP